MQYRKRNYQPHRLILCRATLVPLGKRAVGTVLQCEIEHRVLLGMMSVPAASCEIDWT